jgi:pteridine reductase
MPRCAGVQNVSRPIDMCQEMSQYKPTDVAVTAAAEAQTYQGIRVVCCGTEPTAMLLAMCFTPSGGCTEPVPPQPQMIRKFCARVSTIMATPLLNRVALVTGSAKRLGRAVALQLAQEGADVVIHYRSSEAEARQVITEIEKLGRRAIALPADLAKVSEIQQLFQKVDAHFGRLDILVNSAANFLQTDFLSTTEKLWDASLDTNLKATFFCSQAAAPMLKKTNGAIVNFADIGGILGWPGFIPHSVSKAGVIMLTRALAKELAPEVRVNAIAPGTITMPGDPPEWESDFIRLAPLHRTGKPDDITAAVSYLAGAKFVTGQVLVVDGGRTL